jgi:hypothetical protein
VSKRRKLLGACLVAASLAVGVLGYWLTRPSRLLAAYDAIHIGMTPEQTDALIPDDLQPDDRLLAFVTSRWEGLTLDGVQRTAFSGQRDEVCHPLFLNSRMRAVVKDDFERQRLSPELQGNKVVHRDARTGEVVFQQAGDGGEMVQVLYEDGKAVEKSYHAYRVRPRWLDWLYFF